MMPLRDLVEIIVRAVEKVLAMEGLKLKAIAFDPSNAQALTQAMSGINNKGELYNAQDINLTLQDADILFIDYIPTRYYAKIALGIADCPFTTLMQGLISANKGIVVSVGYKGSANPAYDKLIHTYASILAGYGITFADSNGASTTATVTQTKVATYNAKILSVKDIASLGQGTKQIHVSSSTIVTDLAKDWASKHGITITKEA